MVNKKKGSKSRQVSFASKKQSKAKYRLRNWSAYNASLVKRGSITLWINTADLNTWKPDGPRQRGGQWVYSDAAIQCLWLLRSVFHLTLRATEGFAHSLFQLMGVDLPVPDYSTICRRANGLTVRLPKNAKGPLHVVLDSSGLKIFGEGEWKVRQYGYSQRRTWRKLHLAVDSQTGEVQAVILSDARRDDAAAVPQMLEQVTEPMAPMTNAKCIRVVLNMASIGWSSRRARMLVFGSLVTVRLRPTHGMRTCGVFAKWGASNGNKSLAIINAHWQRQPCFGSRRSLGQSSVRATCPSRSRKHR